MRTVLLSIFISLSFLQTFSVFSQADNSIIVCDNGLEMFQWDLEFLRHAEESVEILACFLGGEIACELFRAVEARLQQVPALQVHVLASPILLKAPDWALIDHLVTTYPANFHIEYASHIMKLLPEIITIDNHTKCFIVDELYFSAGGTNLEEKHCSQGTYTPPRNDTLGTDIDHALPAAMRDQDVVGKGPIAKELRKGFFRLYSLWENYNWTKIFEQDPAVFEGKHYFEVHKEPYVSTFEQSERVRTIQNCQVKCLFSGPYQKKNVITEEYIRCIQEAKEEIILAHLYFSPIDPIFDALVDAVNRGVKLTVITNGLSDISPKGSTLFAWCNRMSYAPLFYGRHFHLWESDQMAGLPLKDTHIYEYHLEDVLLHKKIMLVDQSIFIVGSYNLGLKSAYGDYEFILVFDSKEVAEDARKVHQRDLQYSRKVSAEEAGRWYFDPYYSYCGAMQRKIGGIL